MVRLLIDSFEGFSPADHDAFRPEKWANNRYNLERRRVRERLEALGRAVVPALAEAGVELDVAVSEEVPSLWNARCVRDLWLYFLRTEADRGRMSAVLDRGRSLQQVVASPAHHTRHLFVGVRIGLEGVEVGAVLPEGAWVDRDNAAAACADPDGLAVLSAALDELTPGWTVGAGPTRLTRCYGRDGDETSHEGFTSEAAERLLELAPVYRMVAWARDNDRIGLEERLGAEAAEARVREAEVEEARRAKEEAHRRRAEAAAARAREAEEARRAAEERFRRLRKETPAERPPAPCPREGRPPRRREERPRPAARGREAPRRPTFSEGDPIRLRRGLLAGKAGVVQGVEGRMLRVEIGGLSVRVAPADVELAKEERR